MPSMRVWLAPGAYAAGGAIHCGLVLPLVYVEPAHPDGCDDRVGAVRSAQLAHDQRQVVLDGTLS